MRKRKYEAGQPLDVAPGAVVVYSRISKEESGSVSLAVQADRTTKFAGAMGREVSLVLKDDGYSGKNLRRPAMAQLIATIKTGRVAAVAVFRLDRLTRNLRDLVSLVELLKQHDVALLSVSETLDTDSAFGRAMLYMLGIFAEWERDSISERITAALRHKRENGHVYGQTPYGFARRGQRLCENPEQQQVLKQIRTWRTAGHGYDRIAALLNQGSVAPPKGRAWYGATIRFLCAAGS